MAEFSVEAKTIVHGIIADEKFSDLKSYLERGRRYEGLTDAELKEFWIDAVKEWSDSPFRPSIDLNDYDAEYTLREAKPPYDVVDDDIEKVTAAIIARSEAMSDYERYEANAAMIADYEKNSKTGN